MDFLIIAFSLLFLFTWYKAFLSSSAKSKKYPPGPTPLPLIGSLHKLGDQPHKSLAQLAKIYGPVMSLKLGRITTVVFSSVEAAQEVLQKKDISFANRHVPDALTAHDQSKFAVIWLPVGPKWRSLRKILNTNIFSGSKLDANQHIRRRKVEELITYCRKNSQSGDAIYIGRAAFRTSLNLLSNTIVSKDLTDPYQDSAKEFKELVGNCLVEAGRPNWVDFFPILRALDPQGIRRRMAIHFGKIIDIFHEMINERLESKKSEQKNDVMDAFLNIIKESPEEIDQNDIEHLFVDLFIAGTDTTSSTLEWAMAEVMRSPCTMMKAKAELDSVIGKGKIIAESDVSSLPYLRCIIKETLRIHTPVPFLLPRRVEEDVEACGYIIPKHAQVFVNVWAIGRDPNVWEDPLAFKPERFIDSEVDVRGMDFELIPFGAGRRLCPGVPLAIRMLSVMLGSLLNSFDWKLDGGIAPQELDMSEKYGIALQKAQPLRAIPIPLSA